MKKISYYMIHDHAAGIYRACAETTHHLWCMSKILKADPKILRMLRAEIRRYALASVGFAKQAQKRIP